MARISTKTILIAVFAAESLALALLQSGMDWRRALCLPVAIVAFFLLVCLCSPWILRCLKQTLTVLRRPRFSVRTLFLVTAVAALLLGTLGRDVGQTYQAQAAVRRLEAMGADVVYDTEMADPVTIRFNRDAPPLSWSKKLLGVPGAHVTCVAMSPGPLGRSKRNNSITDDELAYVSGFSNLEVLDLRWTAVTDRGLADISHLRHLKLILVSQSRITEKGIDQLRQALPNCKIHR